MTSFASYFFDVLATDVKTLEVKLLYTVWFHALSDFDVHKNK